MAEPLGGTVPPYRPAYPQSVFVQFVQLQADSPGTTTSSALTVTDVPAAVTPFTEAVISFSASGDNTIITGSTASTIKVYRLILSSTASTSLTFKEGSVSLSGAIPIGSNSPLVIDVSGSGYPWFTTAGTDSFIINSSTTASIGGTVSYIQG